MTSGASTGPDVRSVALRGHAAGLCIVLPMANGSKRPQPEIMTRAALMELLGTVRAEEILGGETPLARGRTARRAGPTMA
jgi:hypothetical protein